MSKGLRKVLLVAYQFPPRGGPGVHRSLNFAKMLPEFGYDPVVFTVRAEDYKLAGDQMDETLTKKIPEDCTVIRTPSCQPFGFIKWANKLRLFRLFWFFGYAWFWERTARWPYKAYGEAKKQVLENDIRLVYTSSGPFSAWILGYLLKKRLGIKWVADLRDPFTDAYMWQFPSRLHWMLSRRWEKKILSHADTIIVNTPEVQKTFIRRGINKPDNIVYITNGF